MRLALRLSAGFLVVLLGIGPGLPADAAPTAATRLQLSGTPTFADKGTPLAVDLTDDTGAPVPDALVLLERRTADTWHSIGTVTTDADGHAQQRVRLSRVPDDNVFRATYRGDLKADPALDPANARTHIALVRRASRLVLGGPTSVVDEQSVAITFHWATGNGLPVAGRVKLLRSLAGGTWKRVGMVTTNRYGRARIRVRPRKDSRWRARAVRQAWVEGDTSGVHRIDNLPPGTPVRLPDAAPRPRRRLPAQRHAVGAGPHVAITTIPDGIWRQMAGISWHRGCPVGRQGLRLVRVNYWDYRGYRRRGELVAAEGAASAMGAAFAEMYRRDLPVRAMYRVDRFGWSSRSHGGDDYASMAAGNTSAFNCRDVTGRPGVRSPHSYGGSLDLNTWENPYRSAQGLVPNSWWQYHSHPRVAWRSRRHAVVRLMARHGLRWTYGLGDTQHFDYVGSRARAAVAPRACDMYCD